MLGMYLNCQGHGHYRRHIYRDLEQRNSHLKDELWREKTDRQIGEYRKIDRERKAERERRQEKESKIDRATMYDGEKEKQRRKEIERKKRM